MEEEHSVFVRSGHNSCPRVAIAYCGVASRPGGASGEGLFGAEDDFGDPHLRERAELPYARSGSAAVGGRRERCAAL